MRLSTDQSARHCNTQCLYLNSFCAEWDNFMSTVVLVPCGTTMIIVNFGYSYRGYYFYAFYSVIIHGIFVVINYLAAIGVWANNLGLEVWLVHQSKHSHEGIQSLDTIATDLAISKPSLERPCIGEILKDVCIPDFIIYWLAIKREATCQVNRVLLITPFSMSSIVHHTSSLPRTIYLSHSTIQYSQIQHKKA